MKNDWCILVQILVQTNIRYCFYHEFITFYREDFAFITKIQ